jgi:ribosomal protein L32
MEITTRKAALAQGLTRYFTGKPCVEGHVEQRYTSSSVCLDCGRSRSRKLYHDFSPAQKQAHNEKVKLAHRSNPEIGRARARKWAEENPDRVQATMSKWRKNNPAKLLAMSLRRREHVRRATPSWANQKGITAAYMVAEFLSKKFGMIFHVDHIIPLRGKTVCGLHVEENLQILSAFDNRQKNNFFNTTDGQ